MTAGAPAQMLSERPGFYRLLRVGFGFVGCIRHNGSVSLSADLGLRLSDDRHFESKNKRASKHERYRVIISHTFGGGALHLGGIFSPTRGRRVPRAAALDGGELRRVNSHAVCQ